MKQETKEKNRRIYGKMNKIALPTETNTVIHTHKNHQTFSVLSLIFFFFSSVSIGYAYEILITHVVK